MARAHTKILKKAIPTVTIPEGFVKTWDIEVVFRDTESGWMRTYEHQETDLEFLEKTPEQFTKDEIISFLNPSMGQVFEAHYDAHHPGPPVAEKIADFKVSDLASTSSANTSY